MGRKRKKKRILTEAMLLNDPARYRRCLALRLFYLLVSPPKLKRLPRVLRRLGAEIPPGWTPTDPWPPGDYIPPEIVFPPDWTPEEPLPPGVVIPPDVVFPPDWTPEDPLPPGVSIPPDTVFPADWTPEDPLPPGVSIPPDTVFPPGWTPADPWPPGVIATPGVPGRGRGYSVVPPIYIRVGESLTPHRPSPPSPAPAELWFDEPFNNLTDNGWERTHATEEEAFIDAGRLVMSSDLSTGYMDIVCGAGYYVPANFDMDIGLKYESGTEMFSYLFNTGTHYLNFCVYPPNEIFLEDDSGYQQILTYAFVGKTDKWSLRVRSGVCDVYKNDSLVCAGFNLKQEVGSNGMFRIEGYRPSTTFTDYITIEEEN